MKSITQETLRLLAGRPEGTTVVAKELLHLGNRAAVDQALSRLARAGKLLRAGRGVYVLPIKSRFGERPPAPAKVVEAMAAARGETVAPHGAAAANALGLTTQVPAQEVYLTTGRSQHLKFGAQTVELRHAPAWQLLFPNRPAGEVLRALAWLGRERAEEGLRVLEQKLPRAEIDELLAMRRQMPAWMAQEVTRLSRR
jgi:Family of unknown function (DUF6088)